MAQRERIYLSPPHMSGKEQQYVQDAIASNWIAPLGPYVDAFEKAISDRLHIPHCAALSSGTAALHLALIIAGVQAGDHVLCPSFTFAASANPVSYLGAHPVFIDSEPTTWNMDPLLVQEALRDLHKKNIHPKVMIVVHLYGMPANMHALRDIADEHGILIIEDAAESLGSTLDGVETGNFGEMAVLSFNGNKIITTSGGGALISGKEDHVVKARFLSTQAREPEAYYEHKEIGYNYRLSNICAAIGCGQMEVLDEYVTARRKNYSLYKELLIPTGVISFLDEPAGSFSNRWLTTILFDKSLPLHTPDLVRKGLEAKNIESRPLWKPLHLQPVYISHPAYVNGTSENCFTHGLCLPSGSALRHEQIEEICSYIVDFLS